MCTVKVLSILGPLCQNCWAARPPPVKLSNCQISARLRPPVKRLSNYETPSGPYPQTMVNTEHDIRDAGRCERNVQSAQQVHTHCNAYVNCNLCTYAHLLTWESWPCNLELTTCAAVRPRNFY